MGQQYDNTNRGVLFKNDRREKDTHPEYNGTINVDGVDYWLSAWVKEGNKGKFFSLSVKPKEQRSGGNQGGTQPKAPQQAPMDDFQDSDIPF